MSAHQPITAAPLDYLHLAEAWEREADLIEFRNRDVSKMHRAMMGVDHRVRELRHIAHDARTVAETGCEECIRSVDNWLAEEAA